MPCPGRASYLLIAITLLVTGKPEVFQGKWQNDCWEIWSSAFPELSLPLLMQQCKLTSIIDMEEEWPPRFISLYDPYFSHVLLIFCLVSYCIIYIYMHVFTHIYIYMYIVCSLPYFFPPPLLFLTRQNKLSHFS